MLGFIVKESLQGLQSSFFICLVVEIVECLIRGLVLKQLIFGATSFNFLILKINWFKFCMRVIYVKIIPNYFFGVI